MYASVEAPAPPASGANGRPKIPIDRSSSHTGLEKACVLSISAACGSSRSQARARTVAAIAAHSSSRIISLLAFKR
jgi:hypothetical protein